PGARLEEPRLARGDLVDAHADVAVGLAGKREAERDRARLLAPQVEHREVARGRLVELVEGQVAAVGAPAPAVAQRELLLVDPVRRAVDDRPRRAVGRQLFLLPG